MVSVNFGTGALGARYEVGNTQDGTIAADPGIQNYTILRVYGGATLRWGAAHSVNYSKQIRCNTSATIDALGTLGAAGLGYYGGGGGGASGGSGGSSSPGGAGNSPVAGGGGAGGSAGYGTGGGGAGGAYGGNGGTSSATAGVAYGDAIMTIMYSGAGGGGGGGAHYEQNDTGGAGGWGGGALQLCAPSVVINGTIYLPGDNGGAYQQNENNGSGSSTASGAGGGGGGGGCFIGTNSISGTGSINCSGGVGAAGKHGGGVNSGDGGGGGGGRIYIKKLSGTVPTTNASGGSSYLSQYNGGGTSASTALYVPAGVGSTIVWFYKKPSCSEFIVINAQVPIEVNGVSWVFSYADNNFLVTDTTLAAVYNLGALYGKLSRTSKNFATYAFKNLFSSVSKIPKEIDIMGQNLDSLETRNIFDFFNAKFLA